MFGIVKDLAVPNRIETMFIEKLVKKVLSTVRNVVPHISHLALVLMINES